jgi:hypothetical protein
MHLRCRNMAIILPLQLAGGALLKFTGACRASRACRAHISHSVSPACGTRRIGVKVLLAIDPDTWLDLVLSLHVTLHSFHLAAAYAGPQHSGCGGPQHKSSDTFVRVTRASRRTIGCAYGRCTPSRQHQRCRRVRICPRLGTRSAVHTRAPPGARPAQPVQHIGAFAWTCYLRERACH